MTMAMVDNFIRIAAKFSSKQVATWKASRTVLTVLAKPSLPEPARKEVVELLDSGKTVTEQEAKEIIARAANGGITKKEIKKISAFHAENMPPLPKPKAAKKEARESGEFVLASDGYYYSPASDEDIMKHEKSLRMTCKVLRAVETLSTMEVTPHQFIDRAIFYMLWNDPKQKHMVRDAAKWLGALAVTWEAEADKIKQKVIDMRETKAQVEQISQWKGVR
jgi:hypothetical protein